MKSLIVILMALLFLSFAEAKTTVPALNSRLTHLKNGDFKSAPPAVNPRPEKFLNTILDYRAFMKLSKEKQEIVLMELQALILTLQKQDDALKTQYQTTSNWLSILINEANAGDSEDRPCVYAGWISSMDMNGRSCLRPKSEGCSNGEIQCNPMLYGTGRCVYANRSATASCESKKKSLSQIVSEIKGHEQEWSNMREELSNYCRDPRPTQAKVCSIIRNRLARIERVIGEIPAPIFEAAPTATATAASISSQTATRSARAQAAPSILTTRTSGACHPATLLANMKPGSSTDLAASTFMDLESARTMMCTTDSIPHEWVAHQKALIQEAASHIRGNDKFAKNDQRNYSAILNNFNACLRDAETLRRTGAGSVSGNSGTLYVQGDTVRIYDENNKPIAALASAYDLEGLLKIPIEGTLRGQGLSICNLRTNDNLQVAPAYSHSPSRTAAPSGATQ